MQIFQVISPSEQSILVTLGRVEMETYLLMALVTILFPLGHIQYFILIELKKKIGIIKFIFSIILYLIGISFSVQLLTSGFAGGVYLLIGVHFFFQVAAIYFLKEEFSKEMEIYLKILRKLKNLGKHG